VSGHVPRPGRMHDVRSHPVAGRLTIALAAVLMCVATLAMPATAQSTPSDAEVLERPEELEPGASGARRTRPRAAPTDPYVLAHYYIWFEATSWNRAKKDFPLLGRYTSDETTIMRGHVRAAKEVGIDGFIVSWKSTEVLDPRLEQLIDIADDEDFKLAITYQSLDFNRDPLPVRRIADDLDLFIERYADRKPFKLFGAPLVALTGTWSFSAQDIGRITSHRREDLQILATAKNVEDYLRVADHVDGNLYYWSSVNPDRYPDYPDKLMAMGDTVRSRGGLWIAPAAPGFDARQVGGTSVVARGDGATLRREWDGALASLPHAIGLISWNEFSENTHIEPSSSFGTRYLEVVADLTGAPEPTAVLFDSDGSLIATQRGTGLFDTGPARVAMTVVFTLGVAVGALMLGRRRSERVVD